jgi:hypothetical protein
MVLAVYTRNRGVAMFYPPAPHRVLVIANETVTGKELHEAIVAYAEETDILVVAPALNSRLRHWTSDEDRARGAAEGRLAACLASLRAAGMQAHGRIGDADPIQAIADALAVFPADELLLATHPEHHSNWLAHNLVDRACACFALPVFHVVVDRLDSEQALLTAPAALSGLHSPRSSGAISLSTSDEAPRAIRQALS